MNSRMTDGETEARPPFAVCCVAIVVALSSRLVRGWPVRGADAKFVFVGPPFPKSATARYVALFLIPQLLPFPLLANEKGAGREDTPSCHLARNTRRKAAGKGLSSLDVNSLLHCGRLAGLG